MSRDAHPALYWNWLFLQRCDDSISVASVLYLLFPCVATSHAKYKVVQIWPGQTVTCLHTNSPGHIWTTLYLCCFQEVHIFQDLCHLTPLYWRDFLNVRWANDLITSQTLKYYQYKLHTPHYWFQNQSNMLHGKCRSRDQEDSYWGQHIYRLVATNVSIEYTQSIFRVEVDGAYFSSTALVPT